MRRLEVVKSRGVAAIPGLHTFRIGSNGIQIFTQMPPPDHAQGGPRSDARATSGVPGLDELIGGGLPAGDLSIVSGPSGTGKTAFCTHFVAEGSRLGEPCVLAIFEETSDAYLARAQRMGFDLAGMVAKGLLRIIYLRPLDLSPDEIISELQHAVTEMGARRLVIDSLNGLELALAPTFREDFAASLYRLVGWLNGGGVSVVFTIEVAEAFDQIKFSPHAVSFMAQNILFLRFVEIEGELKKVLAVIKMRRSTHSKSFHGFEIGATGMVVSGPIGSYRGIFTGVPVPIAKGTP